jgi:hypothetical protein
MYSRDKDGNLVPVQTLKGESGSTLLVVTFTTDESGKHTPSHTYDQIKEWLNNGGSAVLTNGNQWYNLAFMNASTVWFERTVAMSTGTMYVRYVITAMGQMTKTEDTHKLVNVTAEVGQTIIVKEVDEKGKPTKWEAVDYQPRTHWAEQGQVVIAQEQTIETNPDVGAALINSNNGLVDGAKYTVTWNGVPYEVTAIYTEENGCAIICGNLGLMGMGADTGEPFMMVEEMSMLMAVSADTTAVVSITTEGETVHKIPAKFLEQYIFEHLLSEGETVSNAYQNGYSISIGTLISDTCREVLLHDGTVFIKITDHESEDFILTKVNTWSVVNGVLRMSATFGWSNGISEIEILDTIRPWTPPET